MISYQHIGENRVMVDVLISDLYQITEKSED
jgi:hypothetical protein